MSESSNRAFKYGESVFTTMRMKKGQILDWELHFDRWKRGIEFVYGPFHGALEWEKSLKIRVESILASEKGDKILRLTAYLEEEQRRLRRGPVLISDLRLHLETTPFDANPTMSKPKLRTCPGVIRPQWWPSYLKAGDYLATILAQKVYLKADDDDLLFLSPQGEILESSVANIFIVRENRLYTAPLGPGVLDGVMRKKVLAVASKFFSGSEEIALPIDQIFSAEGFFGTNSIRGPFLVGKIDDHELTHSQEFLERFHAMRADIYE